MNATQELFLQPVVQYGFLGFAVILLVVVIWLIHKLTALLEANQKIMQSVAEVMAKMETVVTDMGRDFEKEHNEMFSILRRMERELYSASGVRKVTDGG